VLLLKTKSTPGDNYEDIFSQPQGGVTFVPSFVPVLEHRFDEAGVTRVRSVLQSQRVGKHFGAAYGGLVFTSQRAVEAFTKIVQDGPGKEVILRFSGSFLSPRLTFIHRREAEQCLQNDSGVAPSPGGPHIQRRAGHHKGTQGRASGTCPAGIW